MSDIAIVIDSSGAGDFAMSGDDLLLDEGLETAVIISLFCDRQVDEEELPDGETDRRGWWGDVANADESDRIGSKLWLLAREKSLALVADKARKYCEEALKWMKDDGVTDAVVVTTEIIRSGLLGIGITIKRPSGPVSYRYDYLWQQQSFKRS